MVMPTPSPLQISLFELVQGEIGKLTKPLRCTKATLVHLSHTLEDIVLRNHLPALLCTGFQESSHWREETERYRALAEVAQQVCIFAGGTLPPESSAHELHVTLRSDDQLRQEWFVVIASERFSVVLCGQDQRAPAQEEAMRQFETLWSFDPALINRVLDRMEDVIASYRPERLGVLQQARASYPATNPDPILMTDFTNEMIRFEEQLHQALQTTSQALDEQMRWRDDILATLVHDMRTPLQSLMLTIDTLEQWEPADEAMMKELFVTAKRSTAGLSNLVQLLLDTNQLATNTLPVMWQAIRPATLVAEALESTQPLLDHNHHQFEAHYDADLPLLWGDNMLLVRVLQNLLGNAIKFTPPHGRITVDIDKSPTAKAVEIRVRDTGAGMTSSDLKNIFERYTQSGQGDRRGNGLGLYFCRLVAEAHGGSIRAASQLGVGTTITVVLPALPLLS